MIEVPEEQKKTLETKKFADQLKEALTGINEEGDQLESSESEKILEELKESDEFEQEIEQLLALLNENALDLTKLQAQIILLIRKYCSRRIKNLTIDEKIVNKNIAEVSSYLMQQYSKIIKETNKGLINNKDKLHGITKDDRINLKRLMKSFVVYQIYQFMNPKKIAGETKFMNFAYNMIKGGKRLAEKYEGGEAKNIESYKKKYGSQIIKKLEKAHKGFKGGGLSI